MKAISTKRLGSILVVALTIVYILLASVAIVRAVENPRESEQVTLPRENRASIADLRHRVEVLEAIHVDRELAILTTHQEAMAEKLGDLIKLSIIALTGIIAVLVMQVWRLLLQQKTGAKIIP